MWYRSINPAAPPYTPYPGARTTALNRLFFACGETVPVSLPVLKHVRVSLLLNHPVSKTPVRRYTAPQPGLLHFAKNQWASTHAQAVVLHIPCQGCLTPGWRQDKHHRDVRASGRSLAGGVQCHGRVKYPEVTIMSKRKLWSAHFFTYGETVLVSLPALRSAHGWHKRPLGRGIR